MSSLIDRVLRFVTRNKKWLFLLVLAIVGGYITRSILVYEGNFYNCVVTFSNVSSVKIMSVQGDTDYSEKSVLLKNLETSPSTVRLKKNVSYEAQYTGADGYASGVTQISNNTSVTISPDYSSEKLQQLFENEKQTIQQTISSIEPSGLPASYTIGSGVYYDHAKWYITTIKSTQTPAQYYDTFLVVLKRTNTAWTVAVKPTIIASYSSYPTIPKAVISYANTYRQFASFDEIRQRTVTE